ncbi:MAG: ferredoxin [Firmicutes bacterium]|nr:ferredoxin [Bacillota bacterium]
MKIYIEKGCWGCSLCSVTCPSVFKMDDAEEHAVVHHQPEADNEVLVTQAIEECPAHAINTW